MNLQKLLLCVALLLSTIGFPSYAFGYQTTAQTATRLSDSVVLFTVTYQLGSSKYEFQTPIMSERAAAGENSRDKVSFQILDDDGAVYEDGIVTGLVLGEGRLIEDGEGVRYHIDSNESAVLTLVTFVEAKPGAMLPEDLSLQVTALPFDLISADTSVDENGLNESELQYYRTPESD